MQIAEVLGTLIPRLLRSRGFHVTTHPDCVRLIEAVNDHVRALLSDAQEFIDAKLAREKSKRAQRQKMYEEWIFQVSFHYIRIYKDRIVFEKFGRENTTPCDLSVLIPDSLVGAALDTIAYINRSERRNPGGGRRRSMHISMPFSERAVQALKTKPSDR